MDWLASFWGNVIEPPFVWLGLHDKPGRRFLVVAGTSALLLWLKKPESMFFRGKPRPNAFLSDSEKATPIDWLLASGILGGVSVLFV